MEKVKNLFIYLKKTMKSEALTSNELIALMDKNMADMTHEEKVVLLNEIYKLWYSREIDAYYLGGIMDFINYVEYKIREENESPETQKNWSYLFNDLIDKNIKDISLSDFNEVMNYQRLSKGKERIMWLGKKAEAVYFQEYYKFTMKKFNECFVFEDGTRFYANNRLTTEPEKSFMKRIR